MTTWFKFYGGEYLSDPKMLELRATERSCWLTLLCYASTSQIPGEIRYLDEHRLMVMAGVQYGTSEWDVTKGVLQKFEKLGMVKRDDNGMLTVCNFRKKQETALTVAERVRKHRERNANVTQVTNGNDYTNDREEVEVDIEVEKKRKEKKKRAERRFAPPPLQEVSEYCKERNNGVNAQKFLDFYTSKGWMVGKNKMKDWRAAIRTWEGDRASPELKRKVFKATDQPVTLEEIENRKKVIGQIRSKLNFKT